MRQPNCVAAPFLNILSGYLKVFKKMLILAEEKKVHCKNSGR